MDMLAIASNSLWAGAVALGLGFVFTVPARYLLPAFLSGLVGRGVRDVFAASGMSVNWATLIAATAVVLVAFTLIRRPAMSPVAMMCGVLPLGSALPMLRLIVALMQVSTATGPAVGRTSVALTVDLSKVFTTSLAIAVGLGAGLAIQQAFTAGVQRMRARGA
jgi:uncharacterized membrane protein YjjB (DUF3815 family)